MTIKQKYIIDFNTDKQKKTIINLIEIYNLQLEQGDYQKYGIGPSIEDVIEVKNKCSGETPPIGPTKARLICFSTNEEFANIYWWFSLNLRITLYELNEKINIYKLSDLNINLDELTEVT